MPDNSEAKAKALTLLETGQYADAISLYHVICDADNTDADAWHKLGLCYVRTQKNDDAHPCLQKASELAPDNVEIQGHYANVLALRGDVDGAIESTEKLLSLQATAEIHTFLGNLLSHQQQFDKVITHFQSALELDSSWAGSHAGLAQIYVATNQLDAAKKAAADALTNDPTNEIATQILTQLNARSMS